MDNPNNNLDGPTSPGRPRVAPITVPPSLLEGIEREREKNKQRERKIMQEEKRKIFNEKYKGAIIIERVNNKKDEVEEEEVVDDEIVGEEEDEKDEKREVEDKATFKIPTVPPP